MDNLTEVVLPNGAKAYIKPSVNRRDYNTLMAVMSEFMQVDAKSNEVMPISLSVNLKVQDKALELLLVKLILPDGSVATNPGAVLLDMNKEDTDAVYDRIDTITTSIFNTKKN